MNWKENAPGLEMRRRKNGKIDWYWVASKTAKEEGYPTKTQRIPYNPETPEGQIHLIDACRRLQAEMLQWLDGIRGAGRSSEHGTIGWFCEAFETDIDSPFRQTRQATQVFYSRYLKTIRQTVGGKRVSVIIGKDLRRWHGNWLELHGERSAYGCVQTLRRVFSYGAGDLGDEGCLRVSEIFKHVRIQSPKSRTIRPTYEHIKAFREAAYEVGRYSIALAVSLQFDLGMRQKDIIGEWIPTDNSSDISGIVSRQQRWQVGLTWDHINSDMILEKPTSKSNGLERAVHDLKLYPDTLEELSRIPRERRIGPVILDESTRRPYRASRFSRLFREIADKAGLPKEIKNMDCRAGAVSEAFEAGAEASDVMKLATHKQMATTMIYNRGAVKQSSRVAELRIQKRKEQI